MTRLDKFEKITKIVLSATAVGTVCKIALERHNMTKKTRGHIAKVLSAIGPHPYEGDKGKMARLCLDLLTRPY